MKIKMTLDQAKLVIPLQVIGPMDNLNVESFPDDEGPEDPPVAWNFYVLFMYYSFLFLFGYYLWTNI